MAQAGAMLVRRLSNHPRRTPAALLAFVVLAGLVGGPVAGLLSSSGGFVAPGVDSEVAMQRLAQATGLQSGAGVVVLVPALDDTPLAELTPRAGEILALVGHGLSNAELAERLVV